METFSKMLNSLIEICIVVGMDQNTGLVPSLQQNRRKEGNSMDPRLYSTTFDTSVLAAISGETAFFPHTPINEVDGRPFYPSYGIICSPTKGGARRRRGSYVPGAPIPAELPLGQDVINSLPPLCFPDGGFVSKKRKPISCHSLVLTDIEGSRTYCTCMTFYRGFMLQEVKGEDPPRKYDLLYMDDKGDEKGRFPGGFIKGQAPGKVIFCGEGVKPKHICPPDCEKELPSCSKPY